MNLIKKEAKQFKVNIGAAGFKRAVVLKAKDRSVVSDTGWTKNLLTNSGLDEYCDYSGSSFFPDGYCDVGTGNTAPANSNTALVSSVHQTNTKVSGASTKGHNSSDGYVYFTQGWEFEEGDFNGDNLAEVGFRKSAPDDLGSRSLFLDSGGSPTTVTVLSDEILQVYYEFRIYYPQTDINTSIVDSTTSVNHTVVIRPANVDENNSAWNPSRALGYTSSQLCKAYTGSLGSVTSEPSGSNIGQSTAAVKDSYVSGSYTRSAKYSFALASANDASGIPSVLFRFGATEWQASFSPAIAKDSSKKWDVEFELTVSRASI